MEHLVGCTKLFPKMPGIQGSFHSVYGIINFLRVRTDKTRNEVGSN